MMETRVRRYGAILMIITIIGLGLPGFAQDTPSGGGVSAEGGKIRETAEELKDILDIKPPEAFGIGRHWVVYLLIALLVLLAVVLTWAALRGFRKKKERAHPVIPVEPAHLKGLRLIDELEREQMIDPKPFYFRISIIFREYVGSRFGIDALEMTTEELLPQMSQLDLDSKISSGIREFTKTADPVKFADRTVDPERMRRHLDFIRTFIHKTRPKATDPTQGEAA